MSTKQRVGLIGLGNIGSYYTQQLIKANYELYVFDLDEKKMEYAVNLGAIAAENVIVIAQKVETIILALPGSNAVEQVMDGQKGMLNFIHEGQLIIDTGTSRPSTAVKYEKLCMEKGAGFIDAPLTWRNKGQIIMVGGTPQNFEKAKEILSCISYKFKHIGSIGNGQVLKMINQAILAGQLAVWAENMELTKKYGLDLKLLTEFLEFDVPETLFEDNFSGGGHLALHYKDLGYLLEMAHDSGANIPISSLVHEVFKTTRMYGEKDWIQPGIVTYWRRLNEDSNK